MGRKPSTPRALRPDPTQTFVLKIVPERATDVWRTVELGGDASLYDLHKVIQRHFDLDDDHLYSFFLSGQAWDKSTAYHARPSPGARAVDKRLKNLDLKPGQRFLYLFDYGDELRHEVTVVSTGTIDPAATYPRLIDAQGDPPPQHPGEDSPVLAADLRALTDELAEAMLADEETRENGTPLPRGVAAERLALARRLRDGLAGRPAQLVALESHLHTWLDEWLIDLLFDLVGHGSVDDALSLVNDFAGAGLMERDLRLAFPALLARAGRYAEAAVAVDAVLVRYPEDAEAMERCAFALRDSDRVRAEALYRDAIHRAAGEPDFAASLREDLAGLLRADGRKEEADTLMAENEALEDDEELLDDEPTPKPPSIQAAPASVSTAKVGRNDACPCGGGKKYKKCHGAN